MGSNPEVSSLMSELSVSDINMIIETIPTASTADISGGRIGTGVESSSSVLLSLDRPELNAESDLYGEESPLPVSPDPIYAAKWVSVGEDTTDDPSREEGALLDSGLKDALGAVLSTLDDCRGQFPELQLLEQELRLLQIILKVRRKHGRSGPDPSFL